jgi:glycosyltransferase involved in cell wall biosynthesis
VVVDVDGRYEAIQDEDVVLLAELAHGLGALEQAATAAATLDPAELTQYVGALGAEHALAGGAGAVVVLGAGTAVLADLGGLSVRHDGFVVAPGADLLSTMRRARAAPITTVQDTSTGRTRVAPPEPVPTWSRAFYLVRRREDAELLRRALADWRVAPGALELVAAEVGADVGSGWLITPWVQPPSADFSAGTPLALDLTALDHRRPWILDAESSIAPGVLLSENKDLARVVAREVEARLSDDAGVGAPTDQAPSLLGVVDLDSALRSEARRTEARSDPVPDVLGLGVGPDLESWALELLPVGGAVPCARLLAAVREARPDLALRFRQVPGPDSRALAEWALRHGVDEVPYPDLLGRAAEATLVAQTVDKTAASHSRPAGVNLVGYLAGELGLGESARLVDDALHAVGVPTSTYDLTRDLASRGQARFRRSAPVVHDTTLLCVNGVDVPHVAARVADLLKAGRKIGMWYWELEDFPLAHAAGAAHVDEIWAATDFVRDAIARRVDDVPVRTVTPPLPQATSDRGVVPEHLGIPVDRPWLLFTFDFLSVAERKNPYGLVEAFERAFAGRTADRRPVLVIKTINAARHPGPAERLRLQIAGLDDVMLIDTYLDHDQRHVLVSHCTAYVSLHRAEGLGLTIAEAMAWGRPVITTAYGGVMQFCTPANSFLVDWERGWVEHGTEAYEEGLPWAEPDLDHAAELMRTVVDDPARAERVGRQAALDIRERHNARAAGEAMSRVLDEGRQVWLTEQAAARARRQAARRPAEPTGTPLDSSWPTRLRALVGTAARRLRR